MPNSDNNTTVPKQNTFFEKVVIVIAAYIDGHTRLAGILNKPTSNNYWVFSVG